MYLNLGVTILDSTSELFFLYSQFTVGEIVWSAMASMQLQIYLFFLKYFFMHLISPSVDSEDKYGCICTFHKNTIFKKSMNIS